MRVLPSIQTTDPYDDVGVVVLVTSPIKSTSRAVTTYLPTSRFTLSLQVSQYTRVSSVLKCLTPDSPFQRTFSDTDSTQNLYFSSLVLYISLYLLPFLI